MDKVNKNGIIGLVVAVLFLLALIPLPNKYSGTASQYYLPYKNTPFFVAPFIKLAEELYFTIYREELKKTEALINSEQSIHYDKVMTDKIYAKKNKLGMPAGEAAALTMTYPRLLVFTRQAYWPSYIIGIIIFFYLVISRRVVGKHINSLLTKMLSWT